MLAMVLDTIRKYNMIQDGDKVIVALSGGPDSVCLLHILYSLKQQYNLTLYAAHINHCLRGEESDADEKYAKNLCGRLGIECFVKKVDINKLSKERGLSSESAGREARYEFFEELRNKLQADKIALAHNENDQAETVLMRIIRGSGMEGITGIKPIRGNIFIRPIINIRRDSIEKYCEVNDLRPRIDKSNLENIYARNKIRLELIPYIEENFNEDIISTLNRLADTISRDNDYLENLAQERYKSYCEKKGHKVIIYKEAFEEQEAVLTRLVRKAVNEIKGNLYNVEKVHIYDILKLQEGTTGRKISLPESITAFNNYGNIELSRNKTSSKNEVQLEYTLSIDTKNYIEKFNIFISLRIISPDERINFKDGEYTKYFDADKIKNKIILRSRKDGDRFTPFGMKNSKKLKDFFIDLKIPQEERDKIPLICFDEEIGWVVGFRISENYKISKGTRNILEIKIEK
jgi:tRNA(Ile)-lysidine synthase